LLLILAAALAGGVLLWRVRFSGNGQESRQFDTIPVSRGIIRATIATSGTAEAMDETQLRFATVGRVNKILVVLGQEVKNGDPVAVLESDDLKDHLSSAEANLATARIRLRQLLKGADESELLAADQSVATAQAAVSKGQDDLDELLKGASDADLAAAEQAVASAQSTLDAALAKQAALIQSPSPAQLASAHAAVTAAEQGVASAQSTLDSAKAKLSQLQSSPSAADTSAAEAAVTTAEVGVRTAQNSVDSAKTSLDSAEGTLRAAGNAYCGAIADAGPTDPLCPFSQVPLDQASVDRLLAGLSDPNPTPVIDPACKTSPVSALCPDLRQALLSANSSYVSAQNALTNAQLNLEAADASLTSAQANLDALGNIPRPDDLRAAEAAVTAAEEGLNAAKANVRTAQAQLDGLAPSPEDLAAAQSAVDSAKESVQAAEARLQELQQGADADAVQAAEDAVSSAEATLNAAMAKRDKLVAGADADDVDLQVQQVHLAEITVSEAQRAVDEATLKAPYDGSVSSVDIQVGDFVSSQLPAITLLTPGALKVSLAVGETDLPSLRVGMVGVMIFDALQTHAFPVVITRMGLGPKVEQGVVTYAVEGALGGLGQGPADRPAPGMNGSAILVTEQHQDVLVVPNRAIRRRGDQVVVDVMVDGKVETRTVQTGLSDTDNTEVVSGLAEGDLLALPSTTAAGQQKTPEALPGGIS
jgi:RND family efflux transporter MFP subunit